VIYTAGEYVFHEHYVAFHVVRENAHTPWRVIGAYVTYGQYARCKYHPDFSYMEKEFHAEVELAGDLRGTHAFLDKWRLEHQGLHDVITPVIKYCSESRNSYNILCRMGVKYVNGREANTFAMMAIMLKSRERYFPVVFQERNKDRPKVVRALREAGLV